MIGEFKNFFPCLAFNDLLKLLEKLLDSLNLTEMVSEGVDDNLQVVSEEIIIETGNF